MEPIRRYKKEFDYSYTLGPVPTFELLQARPDLAREVLVSPDFHETDKLFALCQKLGVPCRFDQKSLDRISNKEVAYAACRFEKFSSRLQPEAPHVLLVNPSDMGNLGTIQRTMLAFGVHDLAVVEPCADVFNPKAVRASMGALFKLRVHIYPDFETYRAEFPNRDLFPFMLDGQEVIELDHCPQSRCWTLIFGNEASGLPPEYASVGRSIFIPQGPEVDSLNLAVSAAIGIYTFTRPLRGENLVRNDL